MRSLRQFCLLLLASPLAAATPAPAANPAPQNANEKAHDAAIAAAIAETARRQKEFLAMTPEQKRKMADERERQNRIPLPTDDYDWRRVAQERRVPDEDIRRLDEQKVLVGRRQMKQSFGVYTAPTVPVFITSDALLNGFHSLFEDSFRELEIRRAPELRAYLEQALTRTRAMLQQPPYPMADLGPGWQHAQRVVGPALVLLGTPLEFFDADVRDDIKGEVVRIRAAAVVELPRWLAPATSELTAIDYRRMRPIGFYAGLTSLEDYFRAVRWLQSVPFRPERDVEFTAIALLGAGIDDPGFKGDFLTRYDRFIGQPDDPGLVDANWLRWRRARGQPASWSVFMNEQRKRMRSRPPSVRDTLRTSNTEPKLPWYYVLPAFALPDAQMFQSLVDHGESVTGLQVAQVLGSTIGTDITPHDPAFVSAAVQRASDHLLHNGVQYFAGGPSVYDDYLATMHTLFAPTDPDAPPFMSSQAWKIKSTQTCLAGWTQMRHTFALQAKQVILTLGMHDQPPGFIEPNPEFLRRLSEFLERTHAKLEADDIFTRNAASMSALLRTRADGLDRLAAKIRSGAPLGTITEYDEVEGWIEHAGGFDGLPDTREVGELLAAAARSARRGGKHAPEPLERFSAYLKQRAAEYEQGKIAVPPAEDDYASLSYRWQNLETTVFRLETLLQKQLRGRDWTNEEARFIKGFGPTLAASMGYFGSAYSPRDDVPRCVEIVRDAAGDTSLNAAVGRPRIIYVLYPWHGREIFCEGAVLPYYEFESRERLTDAEWHAKLDSRDAPGQPAWTNPISTPPEPLSYPRNAR